MTTEPDAGFAEVVAERVAGKLNARFAESFISSVLPADIGAWLRECSKFGALNYSCVVPLLGPNRLISDWKVNPDGSIELRLADSARNYFWQGTFQPEAS